MGQEAPENTVLGNGSEQQQKTSRKMWDLAFQTWSCRGKIAAPRDCCSDVFGEKVWRILWEMNQHKDGEARGRRGSGRV